MEVKAIKLKPMRVRCIETNPAKFKHPMGIRLAKLKPIKLDR